VPGRGPGALSSLRLDKQVAQSLSLYADFARAVSESVTESQPLLTRDLAVPGCGPLAGHCDSAVPPSRLPVSRVTVGTGAASESSLEEVGTQFGWHGAGTLAVAWALALRAVYLEESSD